MALPPNCKRITKPQRTLASHTPQAIEGSEGAHFAIYDDAFLEVLGPQPKLKVVAERDYSFAHEAPVYWKEQDAFFFTSAVLQNQDSGLVIEVNKLTRKADGQWTLEEKLDTGVAMGNGAVNYPAGNGILFCDQGTLSREGGLVLMSPHPPYETTTLVNSFHGRLFNSVNDVVLHSDGSVWFTDPCYGFQLGCRPAPQLPNMVYRFEPDSGDLRAVADGFGMPNGLCFSPDEQIMYVTDTDCIHGDGNTDWQRASTIYAFDVVEIGGGRFLQNRRLFAYCDSGLPDGIKCDTDGFVYSGCGDGVHVWHPNGRLVGKIVLPSLVGNFCFGKTGELIILNGKTAWQVSLNANRTGALLHNLGIKV